MKIKDRILKDPRVSDISDERNMGDGIWVYLKDGWCAYHDPVHMVHEYTWIECMKVLREVEKCDCSDCKQAGKQKIYIKRKGSELKVGDTIKVWWSSFDNQRGINEDTILRIVPFQGRSVDFVKGIWSAGARIAYFQGSYGGNFGMTIENDDDFEVCEKTI